MYKNGSLWIPKERVILVLAIVVLAVGVGALNHVGRVYDLFEADLIGYDKIVHFTAGMLCGVFGIWLFHPTGMTHEKKGAIVFAFIVSILIGVGWEFFEVYRDRPDFSFLYWADTTIDVIADVCGGISAALCMHRMRTKQ